MNKFGTMMYDKHRLDHMYCTDHLLQATASIPFKFKFFVGDEMDPSEQGDETTTTMVNAGGQQVTMNLGKGLLAQCRKLVCSFSHSNLKTKALKQAQLALSSTNTKYGNKDNQLNVVIDVVTRWWSTYDMIERLLFLQEALEYMTRQGELHKDDLPSQQQWDLLTSLKLILAPWKDAQMMLESSSIVTSSLVLYIVQTLADALDTVILSGAVEIVENEEIHMDADVDGLLASLVWCAEKMRDDLEERFGMEYRTTPFKGLEVEWGQMQCQVGIHPNFIIAHALDPRFKDLKCIPLEENRERLWEAILAEMITAKTQLVEAREKLINSGDRASNEEILFGSSAGSNTNRAAKKQKVGRALSSAFRISMRDRTIVRDHASLNSGAHALVNPRPNLGEEAIKQQCNDELFEYKKAEGIEFMDDADAGTQNDPLLWWKYNHAKYPVLWILAKYYLSMPATSALSERCFSAAGRLLTFDLLSTKADTVEDCFFIQWNLHMVPLTPVKPSQKKI